MRLDDAELDFAPLSPEFARSPYPFYSALRGRPGLTYFPDFDIWLASRYEDVATLVNDRSLVRSLEGFASPDQLAATQRAGVGFSFKLESAAIGQL
jgi:cytochrome P450